MYSVNQIRSMFLDYFRRNNHEIVASSPLVPHNDPTLMFTNSGMVQFKNVFTGEEKRNYNKASTAQRCVRAGGKHNDLDNVGYTARHHTFFEMLGNFSFGDYFKEDAIKFAWEALTKDFGLDKSKLYVTVYHTDEEAASLWKKISGFSDDRIIRINTNDNFWSMGDTGPCGPCSEIFYDHGDKIWGGLPGTPDQDGDRYIEIWNLVFMQYEQMVGGERKSLPKPSIDTGMGLERLASVLQNVHNNYETDLFLNLINTASDIVKVKPEGKNLTSYRILADHLRSACFLIADGVMPNNEGRGYVLRRIMRRAMRHVHQLGYKDPLMFQMLVPLINEMGQAYPELIRAQSLISDVLLQEELRFKQTLSKGIKLLEDSSAKLQRHDNLNGEIAFKLYDTYGFPLDLTQDILKAKEIGVDLEGFNVCMKEQQLRARAAWTGSGEQATAEVWFDLYQKHGATDFLGYQAPETQAIIVAKISDKEDIEVILTNQTPFYAESGGQMGDTGFIIDAMGKSYQVIDTKKYLGKLHAHYVKGSSFKIGDEVTLKINLEHRDNLRIHHSATHLLHLALRRILGDHIAQKGSLVAFDRLRFDFSHNKALSNDEIAKVETLVNQMIRQNSPVCTQLMSKTQAIESGAMALFGEKYEEEVRVVSMGDSIELCGGTHVACAGDIGLFKITSESAIAAGVRRIEAVCGQFALDYVTGIENQLNGIAGLLKSPKAEIVDKVVGLIKDKKQLEDELSDAKKKLLLADPNIKTTKIGEINLIENFAENVNAQDLRNFVDHMRLSKENSVIIAGSILNGKTSLIIALHANLLTKLDAAELVRKSNELAGGAGGGGRAELAQAGGFAFDRQEMIIDYIKKRILEVGK